MSDTRVGLGTSPYIPQWNPGAPLGTRNQLACTTDIVGPAPLQTHSVSELSALTWASSSPLQAGPLLQLQSNAASFVTQANPNATPLQQQQQPLKPAEQAARAGDTAAAATSVWADATRNGIGRFARKAGVLGPGAGVIGEGLALPNSIADAKKSITQAMNSGSSEDINKAVGDTAGAASGATSLVKGAFEVPQAMVRNQAKKAAKAALAAKMPNAPKEVVEKAVKTAAEHALKDTRPNIARREVAAAAKKTATAGGRSLAQGTGVAGKGAAKRALSQGSKAASKAAAGAVAKSSLKGAAKAAGRFVPGANIAIAGMDIAAAGATLRDPKASPLKKITSVITAGGSALGVIPGLSLAGGAIAAASSFVGSFG